MNEKAVFLWCHFSGAQHAKIGSKLSFRRYQPGVFQPRNSPNLCSVARLGKYFIYARKSLPSFFMVFCNAYCCAIEGSIVRTMFLPSTLGKQKYGPQLRQSRRVVRNVRFDAYLQCRIIVMTVFIVF